MSWKFHDIHHLSLIFLPLDGPRTNFGSEECLEEKKAVKVDEFETADTSGELTRDSKPENTKDNELETKSKEG